MRGGSPRLRLFVIVSERACHIFNSCAELLGWQHIQILALFIKAFAVYGPSENVHSRGNLSRFMFDNFWMPWVIKKTFSGGLGVASFQQLVRKRVRENKKAAYWDNKGE